MTDRLWIWSDLHRGWPENARDPSAHAPSGASTRRWPPAACTCLRASGSATCYLADEQLHRRDLDAQPWMRRRLLAG